MPASTTPRFSYEHDLRKLPLSLRKTNVARLLARRPDGISVAPFEQDEIGPNLFRKALFGPGTEASRSRRQRWPRKLDWGR